MLEENTGVLATLPAPTVDGAIDGTLDPQALNEKTNVRMPAYPGMKTPDVISLCLSAPGAPATVVDKVKIRASQGESAPYISVDASRFAAFLGNVIELSYQVFFGDQQLHTSQSLRLEIKAGFEGEQTLDLSSFDYVLVTGKPPHNPPAFSRFTREATWGVAPYTYASSDATVAVVDQQAEVTVAGNGTCQISATDSVGQSQKYQLTISGIGQLSFLTATANWAGMRDACAVAGLQPATLAQMRQLLKIYDNHAGSLTDYLGRLPYPFWSGELNGANTAWIVDLDKPGNDPLDPNPTSADLNELHQVLGVSMS
ncbi:Uncharacterised protein [Pseudomonas fluorescens]|uniref:BIG2 domain-containing protein n=1 Tax=Pseudomonas fluorescens TaxID=294 RepID=A0A448DVG3_PSEFL|nr:hypothetical protein [Pseudomonas fluorescens]VEF10787.1 Uncharacterised protein [Pseudomonas fluorescens]